MGVRAGPVSWYGGGRRGNDSGLLGPLIGIAVVVGIVVVVVMWPLSLWGHAIHLTPSWHQLMHRNKAWMHTHYPLVGLRYLGAAVLLAVAAAIALAPVAKRLTMIAAERRADEERAQTEAYRDWLEAPPPPLAFPGRFTQNWIADNVPQLHPGQVQGLRAELKARGWSDDRIAQRVTPYLVDHGGGMRDHGPHAGNDVDRTSGAPRALGPLNRRA
jgi:hypothetical protein